MRLLLKKSYLKGPKHEYGDNWVQWKTSTSYSLKDSITKHAHSLLHLDGSWNCAQLQNHTAPG